ncbi:MAG: hypothetical protein IKR18_11095 [Bacteroidaceae bacterium]|nr:hypothetical protein [Bacteroidaceae bacterium]
MNTLIITVCTILCYFAATVIGTIVARIACRLVPWKYKLAVGIIVMNAIALTPVYFMLDIFLIP